MRAASSAWPIACVDLVRAGVRQSSRFQENPRAAAAAASRLASTPRGAPDVVREQAAQLGLKRRHRRAHEVGALGASSIGSTSVSGT